MGVSASLMTVFVVKVAAYDAWIISNSLDSQRTFDLDLMVVFQCRQVSERCRKAIAAVQPRVEYEWQVAKKKNTTTM